MVVVSVKIFLNDLKNSFKDLFPIIAVVTFFQAAIVQAMPENLSSIIVGMLIVAVGLALFIRGLELGIFPIGENLAIDFARKGSLFWLLLFAFTIGFRRRWPSRRLSPSPTRRRLSVPARSMLFFCV